MQITYPILYMYMIVHVHVQGKQSNPTRILSTCRARASRMNREVFSVLQDILTVVVCDQVGDGDAVMCIRHATPVVGFRSPQRFRQFVSGTELGGQKSDPNCCGARVAQRRVGYRLVLFKEHPAGVVQLSMLFIALQVKLRHTSIMEY